MIIITQKCLMKIKNILKYNHGETSLKAPFMICVDLESLLEKTHSCQNNPEQSYTDTNCSFDATKNKFDCYRGEECL